MVRRSLRRYGADACASGALGYHDASVVVDAEIPEDPHGIVTYAVPPGSDRSDPRWPARCPCGRAFRLVDQWQIRVERLFKAPDGVMHALRDPEVPPGAMWDAGWLPDECRGPDGRAWCVRFPGGGDWVVFGPAADGAKWLVTGGAPDFTARPSINLPGVYHGHLLHGIITEDVDGRAFDGVPRTA